MTFPPILPVYPCVSPFTCRLTLIALTTKLRVSLPPCSQGRCVAGLSHLPQPFHVPNKEDTPGVDEAPKFDGSSYDSSDKVPGWPVNDQK